MVSSIQNLRARRGKPDRSLTAGIAKEPLLAVKSWRELFESVRLKTDFVHEEPVLMVNGMKVSQYCTRWDVLRDILRYEVKPTQVVVDKLAAEMITIERDTLYFELLDANDGTTSLWIKYSQIIGSRLVATVPSEWVRQTRTDKKSAARIRKPVVKKARPKAKFKAY